MAFNKKHNPIIFLIIVLMISLLFVIFFPQFKQTSTLLISQYGLIAFLFVMIIMDILVHPIPPDIIIFGLVFSGADFITIALIGGIGSTIAANFDYWVGRVIGDKGFKKWFGKKHLKKGKDLFDKYGVWALIIGAFSPVPYSAVCWTSGIYNMRFIPFFITTLICRNLRFFLVGFIAFLL